MNPDLEQLVKHKIHTVLEWRYSQFPVTLPVPLRHHNLRHIGGYEHFLITFRKSNIRALVYHGPEGLFWYGKDGRIRTLVLDNLPPPNEGEITLFDAEWVPGEKIFYVGDACSVRGKSVVYMPLLSRLAFFKEGWLDLKKPSPRDQFRVVIKEYWGPSQIQKMGSNGYEGLLIRENTSWYKPGRDPDFWHWRTPEQLKILMRLRVQQQEAGKRRHSLWGLNDLTQKEQPYCDLPHLDNTPVKWPDNAFVECRFETTKPTLSNSGNHWITGTWVPTKVRTDKVTPALIKDVWTTASSIQENIKLDTLFDALVYCENKKEDEEGCEDEQENIEWLVMPYP